MSVSKCRACKMPKWQTDPCANADCERNRDTTVRVTRSVTRAITATVKHGFHAPGASVTRLVSEYDAPIHATRWR